MKSIFFLAFVAIAAAGPVAVQHGGLGESMITTPENPVVVSSEDQGNYRWYGQPSSGGFYGQRFWPQVSYFFQQAYQHAQNAQHYVQLQASQGNVPQYVADYISQQLQQAQHYSQNAQQAADQGSHYFAAHQAQVHFQNAYQYVQQQDQFGVISHSIAQFLIRHIVLGQQSIQNTHRPGQYFPSNGQSYLSFLIQRYFNKNSENPSYYGYGFQYGSYGPDDQYYDQQNYGPYQYGGFGPYQQLFGPYQYGAYQQGAGGPYQSRESYEGFYWPFQFRSNTLGVSQQGTYQQVGFGPYQQGLYQQHNTFPYQSQQSFAAAAA